MIPSFRSKLGCRNQNGPITISLEMIFRKWNSEMPVSYRHLSTKIETNCSIIFPSSANHRRNFLNVYKVFDIQTFTNRTDTLHVILQLESDNLQANCGYFNQIWTSETLRWVLAFIRIMLQRDRWLKNGYRKLQVDFSQETGRTGLTTEWIWITSSRRKTEASCVLCTLLLYFIYFMTLLHYLTSMLS